jgi:uncharacterized peroxidase-related enzyme
MTTFENQQPEQPEYSDPIHASNLDVVCEKNASPEIQNLYQQFREDFGRPQVPGILQCFATHPPLLTHMMGLAKSMLFVDGALGRRHKEMISAFVSALNRCNYCADSHAYSFRMQGGSALAMGALLACNPASNSVTAEERTLLQFVKKITEESRSVGPSDTGAMRAAGWTDLQIAETIHVTALFAAFNRVVNAFGLPSQELLKQFEQSREEHGAALA